MISLTLKIQIKDYHFSSKERHSLYYRIQLLDVAFNTKYKTCQIKNDKKSEMKKGWSYLRSVSPTLSDLMNLAVFIHPQEKTPHQKFQHNRLRHS